MALCDALDRERIPSDSHRFDLALAPYPEVQFGDRPPERLQEPDVASSRGGHACRRNQSVSGR